MSVSDNLFLSVSRIVNIRVTPDTLRSKMNDVAATGGVTGKVKSDILIELLMAVYELEKKIDAR